MTDKILSRRTVVAGLPLLLAGCAGGYGPITGEPHPVPFVSIEPGLMRQEVVYRAPYRPGTVVVNIGERRLYLVQQGGRALRYAVGVGRAEALNFHGSAVVGRKETWPHWTPTENMMRATPRYRAVVAACRAEFKIRSGRGRFICTGAAKIATSACMELTNRIRSAQGCRAAASGYSTTTSSTSTIACRSAPRWWCCRPEEARSSQRRCLFFLSWQLCLWLHWTDDGQSSSRLLVSLGSAPSRDHTEGVLGWPRLLSLLCSCHPKTTEYCSLSL